MLLKQSHIFLIICASFIFWGCTPSVLSDEELAMVVLEKSGENRGQLEQIITHYQTTDADPQKLAAAYYLIANLEGNTGYAARDTAQYRRLLDSLAVLGDPIGWDPYLSTTTRWLDSMNTATPLHIGARSDLRQITADYLIANIDEAFEQWRGAPWAKEYTFEEFCEWVLPYRTGSERLDLWRSPALTMECDNKDSLWQTGDMWNLALTLINNTGIYYNIGMGGFPLPMTFSDMTAIRRGECSQMADYALKLFRAHGIPAALDMTPVWANRRSGHVWNVLVLPDGRSREIGYHPEGLNQFVYKLSKIYRRRFSPRRGDVLYRLREIESLPDFFHECRMEDVTAQYDMPVSDITVNDLRSSDHKVAWLCTFDNVQWVPVAYASCAGSGKAVFRDMARGVLPGDNEPIAYINDGKGIVYLPAYFENKRIIPAAAPRILREDGTVEVLAIDTVHRQILTINRKYPKHPDFDRYEKEMVGGWFEGANRSDFSDAVTLLTIERQQAYPMERLSVSNVAGAYRYVRYVAPGASRRGNVAEMQFFTGNQQLAGRPIGFAGEVTDRGPWAAFDGNMESFFYAPDTAGIWIGLDLGQPQRITEVAFAARTDDNEIRLGDTYQLYFWQDGWQPLPAMVAENHRLTWSGVPSNTLYLLRNLSRGVEQRPFTYQNGKQVWW